MLERLNTEARNTLEIALREALNLGHNYIGPEHILLALVRQTDTIPARILVSERVRNDVIYALKDPKLSPIEKLEARVEALEDLSALDR